MDANIYMKIISMYMSDLKEEVLDENQVIQLIGDLTSMYNEKK
jgi:hypothetical protein